MQNDYSKSDSQIREQVVQFLLFMTSEKTIKALKRFIPSERVAFELSRLWFEEIYTPSTRYLTSLKGDFSEERAEQFRKSFSEEEFEALERFHRFFELRIDMLTERHIQQRIFPQEDMWQNILRDARRLVGKIDPDYQSKQERLAKKIEEIIKANGDPFKNVAWPTILALKQE